LSPDDIFLRLNAPNSILAGAPAAPPQTPLGSLQRSPDPLAALKGSTCKWRKGKRKERREKGNEEKGKWKRRGREGE